MTQQIPKEQFTKDELHTIAEILHEEKTQFTRDELEEIDHTVIFDAAFWSTKSGKYDNELCHDLIDRFLFLHDKINRMLGIKLRDLTQQEIDERMKRARLIQGKRNG